MERMSSTKLEQSSSSSSMIAMKELLIGRGPRMSGFDTIAKGRHPYCAPGLQAFAVAGRWKAKEPRSDSQWYLPEAGGTDLTPSGMQGALKTMLFEPRHYNLSIVMVRPIPVRGFKSARQRQRKGWRIARPRSAQSMSNRFGVAPQANPWIDRGAPGEQSSSAKSI
jgi:hypothetical protein